MEEDLDELRAAALASLMLANAQKKAPQTNSAAVRDAHAQQQPRHDGFRPRGERSFLSNASTNHGATGFPRTSGFPLPVAVQTRPRPDLHGSRGHHHPPAPTDIAASSRRHNQPVRDWIAPCPTRGQYVWRKSSPPQHSRCDDIIFGKTNLIVLSELPPQDDTDGEEATRVATRGDSEAAAATATPVRRSPVVPVFISISGTSAAPVDLTQFHACRDDRRGGPSRYSSSSAQHWSRASGGRPAASGSGSRGHRASTSTAAAAATSTKAKSSVPRRFRRLEEDSDSDESDSDDSVDEDRSRHSGADSSSPPSRSASDDEDKQAAVSGAAAEPVDSTSCSAGGNAEPAASRLIEAAAALPATRVPLLQPGSRQTASVGADSTSPFAAASAKNSAAAAADLRAAPPCGAAATPKPEAAAAVVLPAQCWRPEGNLSASVVVSGVASSGSRMPPVQQQPREASQSSERPGVAHPGQRKQPSEVATGAAASASRRDSTRPGDAATAASSFSSKNSGTGATAHRLQREPTPSTPSLLARLVPAPGTLASPATSSPRIPSEPPPSSDNVSQPASVVARNAVDGHRIGRGKGGVTHGTSEAAALLGQSTRPQQPAAVARSSVDRVCPLIPGLSSKSGSEFRTESGRMGQQQIGSTCRSDSVSSRRRDDDAGKQSNENRVAAATAAATCSAGRDGSSTSSSSLGQLRPPESGDSKRRPLAERLGKRSGNSKPPGSATNAAAAAVSVTADTATIVAAATAVQKITGASVGVGSCAPVGDGKRHSDVAYGRVAAAAVGDADTLLSCPPPSADWTVGAASGLSSGRTRASAADQQQQPSSKVRSARISAPALPSAVGEQRAAAAAADAAATDQQQPSSKVRSARISAPVRPSAVGEQKAAADARHAGRSSDQITAARATPAVDDPSRRDRAADTAHHAAVAPRAANPASQALRTDRDRNVATPSAGTMTASDACDRVAGSTSEGSQEQQRKLEARRLKFGVADAAQPQPSSSVSSSPSTSSRQQRHNERRGQQAKRVPPPSLPTTAASAVLDVPASLLDDGTGRASTSAAAAAMSAANAALTMAADVAPTSPGTKRRGERDGCESEPPVKRSPLAVSGVDVRSMQTPVCAANFRSSGAQRSLPEPPPPAESNRRSGDDRHVVVVAASEQQTSRTRPDRSRRLSTARRRTSSSSSSSSPSQQGDLAASGSSRSKASVLARLGHRVVNVVRRQSPPTATTSSKVSPEVAVLQEGVVVGNRLSDRKRSHPPLADVFAEEARKVVHSPAPDVTVEDSGGGSSAKRSKRSAAGRLERSVRIDAPLQHAEAVLSSGHEPKRPSQLESHEDRLPELMPEQPELRFAASELMPELSETSWLEEQRQLHSGRNSPPTSSERRQQAEQLDNVAQQQLRHVQVDRRHGDGRKPSESSSGSNCGQISSGRHASLLQRALRPDRRLSEDDSRQPFACDAVGHSRVAFDESDKRAAEAQLDERIRKIKEKNAAILQRQQMIEAEKQRMGY